MNRHGGRTGEVATERRGLALGYIKRIHELYLPNKFIPLLATLPAGARTPMFSIQSARAGFSRYAWFQTGSSGSRCNRAAWPRTARGVHRRRP